MLQSMKDNINYEAPDDWGVSPEDAWVSFEELGDNGAPILEGRDVVGFVEFDDSLVPLSIRKAARPGTEYKSTKTGHVLTKQNNGRWKITGEIESERPPTAPPSQSIGGPKEAPTQQNPQQQTKPEQTKPVTPEAPEPPRETETHKRGNVI